MNRLLGCLAIVAAAVLAIACSTSGNPVAPASTSTGSSASGTVAGATAPEPGIEPTSGDAVRGKLHACRSNSSRNPNPACAAAAAEAFRLFDADGDGAITAQELTAGMRSLGRRLTDAEARRLLNAGDRDGNGTLNSQEFLGLVPTLLNLL